MEKMKGLTGERYAIDEKNAAGLCSEEPKKLKRKRPNSDVPILRSPICCFIGHAYIGKSKILDCIRGTTGGVQYATTKRIAATYVPSENIREITKELKPDDDDNDTNIFNLLPGLLFLDTPGLTSFTNSISQGLTLCDIAILFVDILLGLQQQSIQLLNLLQNSNKKFIIVLNKVDRLSGWKPCHNAPFAKAYKEQSALTQNAFNVKLTQIITQFKEHGIKTEIYWQNKEMGMGETVSIVPTSAISGEGIPDMLSLLVLSTLKTMGDKLTYKEELQCTVLDVGIVEGRGTTMNAVLVNGAIHEGDQILVYGRQGQIATSIQSLWTPSPMKELGAKGDYLRYKKIQGVTAIKIIAQGIEDAIDGSDLYVVKTDDDSKDVEETILEDKNQKD